jgi:hypothetical protein
MSKQPKHQVLQPKNVEQYCSYTHIGSKVYGNTIESASLEMETYVSASFDSVNTSSISNIRVRNSNSLKEQLKAANSSSLDISEIIGLYDIRLNPELYKKYQLNYALSTGSTFNEAVMWADRNLDCIEPAASGDLKLRFSTFTTVDLILTNGYDSLSDWNSKLVQSGNPYTSISVDEGNYTIYLSGGSNIVLKNYALDGYIENPHGVGHDLLEIQDNGTITEVGDYAFIACDNLTTVELLGATIIGVNSFSADSKLQYVYLPNVVSVGASGFYSAFNAATLPITLYLPLCTSLGVAALSGPINIDTPNGLIATFPIVMQTNGGGGGVNDEIVQLTAYSDGAVINYV